jgi:hypothetical protein
MKSTAAIVILVVTILAIVGFRILHVTSANRDAVLVIALEVASRLETGVKVEPNEIDAIIDRLIRASVIHGHRGRQGESPTNVCWKPFQVDVTNDRMVICRTKGIWGIGDAESVVPIADE